MNTRTLTTVTALMLTLAPAAALAGTTLSAAPDTPPEGPAHGVNETTFLKLWSEDDDTGDPTDAALNSTNESDGLRNLMSSTDWAFEQPPQSAINSWNDGDHDDFQHGGYGQSVYPANTDRTNSTYIKDAYIRTFSITPSTTTYSETGDTTQYITSDGTVRAISDYRLNTPADDTTGDRRVEWSVDSAEVSSTTLYVDGQPVDTVTGTQTPELSYQDIESASTITVEATITASLTKEVRTREETCQEYNGTEDCISYWHTEHSTITDSTTVTDTQSVTVESFDATGTTVTQSRDGQVRTGYAIQTTGPWSRIELPDGTVIQSSWRFYTASGTDWDTLVTSDGDERTTSQSSVQPVRLYAFPSEYSVDTTNADARIVEQNGATKPAPSLPETIDVGVANESYTATSDIVVEVPGADSNTHPTVYGLTPDNTDTPELTAKQSRQVNLTLTHVDKQPGNVTVTVRVEDNQTGAPITSGTVTVGDTEAPLNESGEATITASRGLVSVPVTYTPTPWWESTETVVYTGTTDSVSMGSQLPNFDQFVRVAVATLFWLVPMGLAIYGLNVMSDGAIYNRGER